MNAAGGKTYRPWNPEPYAHQAHARPELPEDDLVFFLIELVPKLDLSRSFYPTRTRPAAPSPSIPP